MSISGQQPLPANPLKTTTAEIYRAWQDESAQLQRRWNEFKANAQEERGEVAEEAEGLRLRIQGLRDLIAEAVVVGEDPASWSVQVSTIRLGSVVRLRFDDGNTDEFLFIGLAGPSMEDNVITPKTPLGAAVLGHQVGERVAYHVGSSQYQVVVTQCLVPPAGAGARGPGGGPLVLTGANEEDEALKVAKAIQGLLRGGTPAPEIVVAWRAPYQSRPFEAGFAKQGLRYRLEGTDGFYDCSAVRSILALLRLTAFPTDGSAVFQALRGVTHAPVDALERLAATWTGPEQTPLPPALAGDKGVAGFLQAMYKIWPRAASLGPGKVLAELGQRVEPQRPEFFGGEFDAPWPAVARAAASHRSVRDFLAHAEETAARSRRGARDGVILMPLTQIGSRDFNALFVVGANEGAIPLLPKGQESLPGERELFYEALAAARFAALSWSKTIGGSPARPSRFIAEVTDAAEGAEKTLGES